MCRIAAAVLVTAALTVPGQARERVDTQDSAPIIAGQPEIRVSPSGNVIAPADPLATRDVNGKVRVRHDDVPPPAANLPQ